MKVILLDNIIKLGQVGSEINVKAGYARNFLIPQSKAVLATKKNTEIFKEQQHMLKSKLDSRQDKAELCAKLINNLGNITITARSSNHGKLFGSIGPRDIAKVITESVGFKIFKSQIKLINTDTLKSVGTYNIRVHIYHEIYASLNVNILDISSRDKTKTS